MQICLLSATPCSICASSHPMTEGSLVSARLLVFRVGTLACAADVDQVREILPRLPTTRIPGAPPVVAGLVNVRGTLVTVVEGGRALGLPPLSPTPIPRRRPDRLDDHPRTGQGRGLGARTRGSPKADWLHGRRSDGHAGGRRNDAGRTYGSPRRRSDAGAGRRPA